MNIQAWLWRRKVIISKWPISLSTKATGCGAFDLGITITRGFYGTHMLIGLGLWIVSIGWPRRNQGAPKP